MDKFCLKWYNFHANIRDHFKKLRADQKLFDVTLVTEDGQYIQAHKMVLSAGSSFFNNILMKNNHSNMVIYLKGIKMVHLDSVTDFIYEGETFVSQEDLEEFLETATDLQIKGLLGDLKGMEENSKNEHKRYHENNDNESELKNVANGEDSSKDMLIYPRQNTSSLKEYTADLFDEALGVDNELDIRVEDMLEKGISMWRCKVCGKTATHKSNLKQHAEIHIEGLSFSCNICNKTNKTFATRNNLRVHIQRSHMR